MRKPLKKTVILLGIFLLAFTLGAAGTKENPLVSLAYLTGAYRQTLLAETETAMDAALAASEARLLARYSGDGALTPPDTDFLAARGECLTLARLGAVIFAQGTEFVLTRGEASLAVLSGEVLDVSDGGARVAADAAMAVGHRYIAAEDSGVEVTAATDAEIYVNGFYKAGEAAALPFRDVGGGDWFMPAVEFVYTRAYFNGTSATAFSPKAAMTRGMFVTVLYRLDGAAAEDAEPETLPEFTDIADPDAYYYAPVRWAAANEIVLGFEDGAFLPDENVTREQMAALLYRYAEYAGYEEAETSEDLEDLEDLEDSADSEIAAEAAAADFPDWEDVSEYAQAAFEWACASGIINGSGGQLLPREVSTRAQVAQVIMNYAG